MRAIHHRIAVGTVVLLCILLAPAARAMDILLKLDGIQGESKAQGHVGEIDLTSAHFGVEQVGAANAVGAAGRISFSRLQVVKRIDLSTPALFTACAAGKHIASATISFSRSGQDAFLRYILSDVTVASVSWAVDQTDVTEQVSFAFGKIEIEYRATGADGNVGAPVRSGFDLGSNKAVMSGAAPADAQLGDASDGGGDPSAAGTAPAAASPPLDRARSGAPLGAAVPAAATELFTQARNAALKGRLGRLVIEYPKDTPCKSTRVDVYKPGTQNSIAGGYGNQAFELIPGSYDVAVSSKRIANVAVSAATDTRLSVGVLKVHGGKDTRFDVLDADNKTQLTGGYGDAELGLPIGSYQIRIAGQSEPVTIKAGQTTEF